MATHCHLNAQYRFSLVPGYVFDAPLRSATRGLEKPESIQLFNFVKGNTHRNDAFIFIRPRVLALFTGRRASVYHSPAEDATLWEYPDRIGAGYIVVSKLPFFPSDRVYLSRFIKRHIKRFELIFNNPDFAVYRIGDTRSTNSSSG